MGPSEFAFVGPGCVPFQPNGGPFGAYQMIPRDTVSCFDNALNNKFLFVKLSRSFQFQSGKQRPWSLRHICQSVRNTGLVFHPERILWVLVFTDTNENALHFCGTV